MFVKHFVQHSFSPGKPKREQEILRSKSYAGSSMLREDKELSEVENKTDQMLDRVMLSKISTTKR